MAKVLGQSGRYTSEESIKRFGKTISSFLIGLLLMSALVGYSIAKNNFLFSIMFLLGGGIIFYFFYRKALKHERYRFNYRRGADGEFRVGNALGLFPDEYNVLNDLKTDFGNIDHVVVGPTGVYVLDAKNWRGIITADENGEILLNGKPTNKPEVKILTSRVMNIKEKVKTLCHLDPYIQGVLVFPSARVDARWGTTKAVHCVKDDRLYDYIVENKKPNKLSKKEIDSISQAFLALARMDTGFEDKK
ncbi:MAG: NERD domain-containing protein [Thermodesulfovibrionales bacterium]|nr:NERD domain-containing protein [Nitrospinota bacterium]MBU4509712.1 NERD domain-containing protein [bacterium]MCG2708710.1 NERD domain-containing protein [Thermodesulfovibrionales bacterium]